jgi:hypothetical protein
VFLTLVDLFESSVTASDGVAGSVVDAYVDDRTWSIRYLVVIVAAPEGNKEMVCLPEAITDIDLEEGCIHASSLSPRHCASVTSHRNVRSSHEVLGCAVSGWNRTIGRADDAIFETDSWVLRYFLIDGGALCKGAVVLIPPALIEDARWEERALLVADTGAAWLCGVDGEDAIASLDLSRPHKLH